MEYPKIWVMCLNNKKVNVQVGKRYKNAEFDLEKQQSKNSRNDESAQR